MPLLFLENAMNFHLQQSWRDLLSHWTVDSHVADRKFVEVRQAYASPGRFYHTLDHVAAVLRTVSRLTAHVRDRNAVELAAWLHDVIYDSKANDNEERSAQYAEALCGELAIPNGIIVASLIRTTKTHDASNDADAQVLLDADLAILGANEVGYLDYAANIRLEYAWVPEADYRAGRARVLRGFLTRPRIYHFLSDLEESARHNISLEISRLESSS